MKRLYSLLVATLYSSLLWAQTANICIVPYPTTVEEQKGSFAISNSTAIVATSPELMRPAQLFAEGLGDMFSPSLRVVESLKKRSAIYLSIDTKQEESAYTLRIDNNGVKIAGGSPKAVFYGLQSLRQMILSGDKESNGRVVLPAVNITDAPHFDYRGAMFDVCRHMFTVEEVKQFIDILALHKISRFHWHLTEDQGWRIEIKRYPELTRVGSMRKQTIVGNQRGWKGFDGTPHGGYFSQDEVRDVVKYAADRYIEVIPEIEMPGHSVAALASYPWLGCRGKGYEVAQTWGVFRDVYCAGDERTFEFLENVLSEVIELFPSKYIHIGGDECPKESWKACPKCQQRIADNGLKDEHELQSYFIRRIERWLAERGRSIIGWDEILEGGVEKTATIMSWRGTKGGIAAAKMGNNVIMSPNSYCYVNYFQTADHIANGEPLGHENDRHITLRRLYSWNPYEGLNDFEQRYITGVQVNLWTEFVAEFGHAQRMLLPRLAALSEVGWSASEVGRRDYDEFMQRMRGMRKVYDRLGMKYSTYAFDGIE